jgi:hypothetical protein
METNRRRIDRRRPTDVPTTRIPRLNLADIAAEYVAAARVQLCDVAAAGVSAPDERLEIGGRRYSMDEARAALGVGGAR